MIPLMGCHDDIIDIYNKSWKHISTTKSNCVVRLWLEYVYYPGTILILNMESVLDEKSSSITIKIILNANLTVVKLA